MACFARRSERSRRYYELPRNVWERILLWLPPRAAISAARVCKLLRSITTTNGFWEKKMKWDFHGEDPYRQEYRALIQQLYPRPKKKYMLEFHMRQMTNLSFGIKKTADTRLGVPPRVADHYVLHGNRLNSLRYRGKYRILVRKTPEYRTEYYCGTCGSTDLYVGSRWSYTSERYEDYYRCKNPKCTRNEIDPRSRRVPTGLFTICFRSTAPPGKCVIL